MSPLPLFAQAREELTLGSSISDKAFVKAECIRYGLPKISRSSLRRRRLFIVQTAFLIFEHYGNSRYSHSPLDEFVIVTGENRKIISCKYIVHCITNTVKS